MVQEASTLLIRGSSLQYLTITWYNRYQLPKLNNNISRTTNRVVLLRYYLKKKTNTASSSFHSLTAVDAWYCGLIPLTSANEVSVGATSSLVHISLASIH